MFEGQIQIIRESSAEETAGDFLHVDREKLGNDFTYNGLWFARDRSEESAITTELYYSADSARPAGIGEELKENSFQQVVRFRIPGGHKHIWVSARTETTRCGLKLGEFRREQVYVNYRVIRNRASGFDVIRSGVIKGGQAFFAPLGIEDMRGAVDYKEALYYMVLIKDPPPEDWGVDAYLGVEGVPVVVPSCTFTVDGKYSSWAGRNPLDES